MSAVRKKRKNRQVRAGDAASFDETATSDKRAVLRPAILSVSATFVRRIHRKHGMNSLLYALTVLIWGTTWIAIKWQLGVVPAPVSIAYRFWIAAAVLLLLLMAMRKPVWPPRRAWRYLAPQGLALFCCNFLCFYFASQWVPSGLVAVVFSTAPLWNAINGRLFLGRAIQVQVMIGALLGLGGIVLLFLPQMSGHWHDGGMLRGLGLALLGTLCFSAGNLLSSRMQSLGLTPWLTNTWAMLIGASVLTVASLLLGLPLAIEPSPRYVGSLLYLAIPGSVIGFTAYLMLVGRMGPERAAYCTVLFPVVALTVSTVFEGYQWSIAAFAGLAMVLAGNLLAFMPVTPRRSVGSHDTTSEPQRV
jgi:drug/metabolite transporter (DMT)-like permease